MLIYSDTLLGKFVRVKGSCYDYPMLWSERLDTGFRPGFP